VGVGSLELGFKGFGFGFRVEGLGKFNTSVPFLPTLPFVPFLPVPLLPKIIHSNIKQYRLNSLSKLDKQNTPTFTGVTIFIQDLVDITLACITPVEVVNTSTIYTAIVVY